MTECDLNDQHQTDLHKIIPNTLKFTNRKSKTKFSKCCTSSSPIWIVPKKVDASRKQKMQVVIDYWKLNELAIDDKYPFEIISDLLCQLGAFWRDERYIYVSALGG